MIRLTTIAALLALTGCQGANGETYLGMPGSPAWFATASPETIAQHFAMRCAAYGFTPGTPDMARCVQSEAQGQRSTNAFRGAAMAANINANRPRNTTCNRFGSTVNCTSY